MGITSYYRLKSATEHTMYPVEAHKMLHTSDRMKQIFTETPILAFKRDKNLQDILVYKKHNNLFFSKPNRCELCEKYCAVRPYIVTSNKFEDHGGKQYNVKNYINCQSTNVVYAVFCKKCTKYVYVGETGDTLYQRQLLNLSRIKTKYGDPVAIHFYTDGHTLQDFSVMGIEELHGDEQYRKTIENVWNVKLSTY